MSDTPHPIRKPDDAAVLAGRLILQFITRDSGAYRVLRDEIGDCAGCWRLVAIDAGHVAAQALRRELGTEGAAAALTAELARALPEPKR